MAGMSILGEPGHLSRTPLAAILLEVWNLRLGGELTVEHGSGISRVWFREGVPVGAQSFAGFLPVGQILLENGDIDFDALDRSLSEMARTGRYQGEILVELGVVDQATVDHALALQQATYLSRIAALDDGTYRFDPQAPIPGWTQGVRVAPLQAVRQALASPQGAPLVDAALRNAAGDVALTAAYGEMADAFAWGAEERALVEQVAAGISVAQALAATRLPAPRARAALATLLLVGAAEPLAPAVDLSVIASAAETGTAAEPDAGPTAPSAPAGVSTEGAAPATAPDRAEPPQRRGSAEEARARRQRLLARAMQNMGVGPRPPAATGSTSAPPPDAPAAASAATAPTRAPPAAAPASASATAPAGAPTAAPAAAASPGKDPAAPPKRTPGTPAEEEARRALLAILPLAADPNLFARLGLPTGAGPDEVKTTYLQLVRRFHPDRLATPAFADVQASLRTFLAGINEAYATLTDPARRREYLSQYARGGRATSAAAAESAKVDVERAEAALQAREFSRARMFLEAALRADRRSAYLVLLARAILGDPAQPDRERARGLLEEAMKDATCDAAFVMAGEMARRDGDATRAEKLFRAALRANPRNAEAARMVREFDSHLRSRADARRDAKS